MALVLGGQVLTKAVREHAPNPLLAGEAHIFICICGNETENILKGLYEAAAAGW